MKKPTQGAAFKSFRDQFMGVTESQDPVPGNTKKYLEDKVGKHGQKAASNAALTQK